MKPLNSILKEKEREIISNPYDTSENKAKKLPETRFRTLVDFVDSMAVRLCELEEKIKLFGKKQKRNDG